jgi:hypothetical protein
MPIQFACPSCGKQHKAPHEYAGKKAKCVCGAVLVVPALASPPASKPVPTASKAPAASPSPPPSLAAAPATPNLFPDLDPTPSPAGPSPWEFEQEPPSKPVVRRSSLAKLLKQRRMLIVAAGAVVAVVLLVSILWMLFGRGGASDAMRYLPNDCIVVATTDFDALSRSSFYQQMQKDLPAFNEHAMEQEIGFAPSNISRITFALGGKVTSAGGGDPVLVMRLKKAITAAEVKAGEKSQSFKKDIQYDESKVAGITLYEETFLPAFAGDKAERQHGAAFCLPESTLVVTCPKLDMLKRIVERGKAPEFSEGMQNAMKAANFSKVLALAVNVKALTANDEFKKGLQQGLGSAGGSSPLGALNAEFFQNMSGLALDASLDSSKATVNATLLCKDAKSAEDTKKILDAVQVFMRNTMKGAKGVPPEVTEMVDGIKFAVSGATVNATMQASLDPLSKWMKEQARKR